MTNQSDHFRTALEQIRDASPPEAGLIAGVDTWSEFAERLQKRAGDALRGVVPDRQNGDGLYMPTYGKLPWEQLGRDVMEAITGQRDTFKFTSGGYPGHDMAGINFNSLARIVDKYRLATPQPTRDAAEGAEETYSEALAKLNNRFAFQPHAATTPKPAPDVPYLDVLNSLRQWQYDLAVDWRTRKLLGDAADVIDQLRTRKPAPDARPDLAEIDEAIRKAFSKPAPKLELTAQLAYEACAEKQVGVLGWDKEPDEIKLGWYHAAKLWYDAAEKARLTIQCTVHPANTTSRKKPRGRVTSRTRPPRAQ